MCDLLPLCRRTQTYQTHDPVGASPPLTPCAVHIKGLTQESHPTAPTNLGKDDLLELEGGLIGTCDGQPVGTGPQTNQPSVGTADDNRGSDALEDRAGGGKGVEPSTKTKSRKVQVIIIWVWGEVCML